MYETREGRRTGDKTRKEQNVNGWNGIRKEERRSNEKREGTAIDGTKGVQKESMSKRK